MCIFLCMMPDLCVRNKQTKASKDKTESERESMRATGGRNGEGERVRKGKMDEGGRGQKSSGKIYRAKNVFDE